MGNSSNDACRKVSVCLSYNATDSQDLITQTGFFNSVSHHKAPSVINGLSLYPLIIPVSFSPAPGVPSREAAPGCAFPGK